MTDGGTFNGKTIAPLGINKVAAIYYEVQTHLLTSGSDYLDLYYALNQGCLNLVGGTQGITLGDCQQVRNATEAVQMNQQPVTNFNPGADLCPAGMSTCSALLLFKDDMENGRANWMMDTPTWSYSSGYASSGTKMLWGSDYYTLGDGSLVPATDINLPTGSTPFLYFKHAYDFEYGGYYSPPTAMYYDGGVLEYSVNGGATFPPATA